MLPLLYVFCDEFDVEGQVDADNAVEVGFCADQGDVRKDVARVYGGTEFGIEEAMVFEDAREEVEGGGRRNAEGRMQKKRSWVSLLTRKERWMIE